MLRQLFPQHRESVVPVQHRGISSKGLGRGHNAVSVVAQHVKLARDHILAPESLVLAAFEEQFVAPDGGRDVEVVGAWHFDCC